jgi:hypothetical protein
MQHSRFCFNTSPSLEDGPHVPSLSRFCSIRGSLRRLLTADSRWSDRAAIIAGAT